MAFGQRKQIEQQLFELCARCQRDPLLFVECAFPWGVRGGPLEQYPGPDDWQRESLEYIRDNLGKGRPIRLAIAGGVGPGKSALGARLPMMCGFRELVDAGCLTSYGPNLPDLYRRAAEFADKILRGTKPADIPVEQPTRFDFVLNLTTAKAIGLDIPETLLARADEIIE